MSRTVTPLTHHKLHISTPPTAVVSSKLSCRILSLDEIISINALKAVYLLFAARDNDSSCSKTDINTKALLSPSLPITPNMHFSYPLTLNVR